MSDAGLRAPVSGLVLRSSRFGFSFRTDLRAVAVTTLLLAATFAVFAWSMTVGDFPVPIRDVVSIVFGGSGEGGSEFIVRDLRLPRATLGVVVGAAFGVAGGLFQRVADNPLASPDIIGINSGAAAAAVATIVLWSGTVDQVTAAALAGGIGTAVLIYVLSYRSGVTGYRLVLVGIGMSALLRAVISYLLAKAQLVDATRASVWMVGSLNGRGWDDLVPLAVATVVLVPVAMASGRQLRMLELGVDTAIGLGSSVRRTQALMLLIGVALAALATASAGPIVFVSLASPQIARRLTGVRTVGLLPAAATGALLLLASDLIARRLFAPTEIPVGIVTGVLGAPFLLYLLAVGNRIGRG